MRQTVRASRPAAVPNVFHQRIGPVRPVRQSVQRQAAQRVEQIVHRLPGRARPPIIPVLRSYNPAQQRLIQASTERFVRGAAADRGYSTYGQGTAPLLRQISRYGTGRERQAIRTYARGNPLAVAQAKLFRSTVLADARQRGPAAVLGGPSIDFGPPGVAGYRSPAAVKALHRALLGGNLAYQSNAGARIGQALSHRTYNAAQSGYKATPPLEQAATFALSPKHNAFAAVTSGLYKNSAAFRDLFDLPANTVSSLYNTGAGVVEALGGDTRRIRALAKGITEHDPLALLIEGKPGRALFEARTHPVSTALEVSGVVHGLGRGAEIASGARRGALGRGVDYTLPGTGVRGTTRFSGHAAVRLLQRARADKAIVSSDRLRLDAAKLKTAARTEPDRLRQLEFQKRAQQKLQQAAHVDPRVAKVAQIQRWVDEHNAAVEDVRRVGRARAMKAAERASQGKHPAIQSLYAQGIIHLTKRDIGAYARELDAQAVHLTGARLAANTELRAHLERALRDKNFDAAGIRQKADQYRAVVAPLQAELIRERMLNPAAAERAPLMGYAVRRMGASYSHGDLAPVSAARLAEIGQRVGELQREYAVHMRAAQRAVVAGDRAGADVAGEQAARVKAEFTALRDEAQNGAPHTGLVGPDGKPLSNDAIRAHMLDPNLGGGRVNPAQVVYLPQKFDAHGAANYYRSFAQRETHRIGSHTRTGEAVRQGTFDVHPDSLVAHAANVQGLVDANRGFLDFYRQFGFRPHDERTTGSYDHVAQVARDVKAESGRDLVPIRIQPWGESQDRLTALLDHASATHFDSSGREISPVHDSVMRALDAQPTDPGPFGLVDAAAAERLRQHMKLVAPNTGSRALQVVNQAFRRTVLPFSPKWVTGNVLEAGLRTAIQAHFNPVAIASDYALMRRVLAAHDSFVDGDVAAGRLSPVEAARMKAEVRARTVGGGHFEMNVRTQLHRTAEQFANTKFKNLARAMGALARAPGVKQGLGALRAYTDWMMHTVNGTLERQFQTAMAGRGLRVDMFDRKLPTVQARAVADFARGLRETPAQVELGRIVDRAYGKYSKFDPTTRWLTSTFTPFIAWTRNAFDFLTRVLPADHPVLTGLLAVNHEANHDWLASHGLIVGQAGGVPDWLLGTVPGGGGHIQASRYTPFGLVQGFPGNLSDLVLPQVSGFLKGLQGIDWKNAPVRSADTIEKRFALGISQFAESNIPIYAQASQILGRKGSLGTKLERQFNPFFPIQNTGALQSSGGGGGKTSGPSSGWTLPDGTQSAPSGGGQSWTLPQGQTKGAHADYPPNVLAKLGTRGLIDTALAHAAGQTKAWHLKLGPDALLQEGTGAATDAIGKTIEQQVFARQHGPTGYKAKLFAHPQRPNNRQLALAQLQGMKLPSLKAAGPGPRTSPKLLRRLAVQLKANGYSTQQIRAHIAGGRSLKQLGFPAHTQKGVVEAAAKRHGIPPSLLWGVYGAETAFGTNHNTSSAGAQGPFQFMPGTADSWIKGGRKNIGDFHKAADGAARLLGHLLQKYHGNTTLAAAAYNAGEGNVDKAHGVPPIAETQAYVRRVAQLGKGFSGKGTGGVPFAMPSGGVPSSSGVPSSGGGGVPTSGGGGGGGNALASLLSAATGAGPKGKKAVPDTASAQLLSDLIQSALAPSAARKQRLPYMGGGLTLPWFAAQARFAR